MILISKFPSSIKYNLYHFLFRFPAFFNTPPHNPPPPPSLTPTLLSPYLSPVSFSLCRPLAPAALAFRPLDVSVSIHSPRRDIILRELRDWAREDVYSERLDQNSKMQDVASCTRNGWGLSAL